MSAMATGTQVETLSSRPTGSLTWLGTLILHSATIRRVVRIATSRRTRRECNLRHAPNHLPHRSGFAPRREIKEKAGADKTSPDPKCRQLYTLICTRPQNFLSPVILPRPPGHFLLASLTSRASGDSGHAPRPRQYPAPRASALTPSPGLPLQPVALPYASSRPPSSW